MLIRSARSELEQLQRLLTEELQVPARAERFHRERNELAQRVTTLLGRWWPPWIDDDELSSLNETGKRLAQIAGWLSELNQRAESLLSEVQELKTRAAETRDSELRDWFAACCEDSVVRLRRIGVRSDRSSELDQEQRELTAIEARTRLHLQAVQLLQQAAGLQARLAAHQEGLAEALRNGVPQLAAQALRAGINHGWLDRLGALVGQAKELVASIEDPPQPLQTVNQLLPDLRGWAKQLGECQHEVEELTQRHRTVTQDWLSLDQEEINKVLAGAEELGRRLRDSGRERRTAGLHTLEARLGELIEACGPQPKITQKIEPLLQQRVQRHQEHAAWLGQLEDATQFFDGIAYTYQQSLRDRLKEQKQSLTTALEGLRAQPLSDQARAAAQQVEIEIERLSLAEGPIGLLEALQRVKTIRSSIEQQIKQARHEKQELLQRQRELRQQSLQLQTQAAQVDLGLEDHGEQISQLSADGAQLEAVRAKADRLAATLARQEAQLAEHCRQRLAQVAEQAQHAASALQQAGFSCEALDGMKADETGAAPTVEAVHRQEQLLEELHSLVEQALTHLDRRRQESLAELQALQLETLPPGQREDAEHLLSRLSSGSLSWNGTPVDRLALQSKLLVSCELYLEGLQSEQRQAANRLQCLRQRLQSFQDDLLRSYCPELTDRVTALVHGLAAAPHDWQSAGEQLAAAEQLLTNLELQARRLAAAELESNIKKLRRRVGHLDGTGAPEQEVGALLAELDRLPPFVLPDATLRMRARSLVSSTAGRNT